MKEVSEFKKSYRVYAVVGAACANSTFRRKLFDAFNAVSVDNLRDQVNRCLALAGDPEPHVTNAELMVIWAFVAPRTIVPSFVPPILEPPVESQALQAESKTSPSPAPPLEGSSKRDADPTRVTFEVACEAFSRSVCPHWPCDDFSE